LMKFWIRMFTRIDEIFHHLSLPVYLLLDIHSFTQLRHRYPLQ
jgi:hypothetical protein